MCSSLDYLQRSLMYFNRIDFQPTNASTLQMSASSTTTTAAVAVAVAAATIEKVKYHFYRLAAFIALFRVFHRL